MGVRERRASAALNSTEEEAQNENIDAVALENVEAEEDHNAENVASEEIKRDEKEEEKETEEEKEDVENGEEDEIFENLQQCPCCLYFTLHERGAFEICPVCYWEDDGQDESDVTEVRNGPNGELSLSKARQNFATYAAADEAFIANV